MTTGAAATRRGPARGAPDSSGMLERARKILLHEQRMGCLDRAVVGGLERFFLQLSAGEPAGPPASAWLRAAVRLLAGCGRRSSHERRAIITRLLERLSRLEPLPPAGPTRESVATAAMDPGTTATTRPASAPWAIWQALANSYQHRRNGAAHAGRPINPTDAVTLRKASCESSLGPRSSCH